MPALSTIASLAAASAAQLSADTRLPVDDALGATRGASFDQVGVAMGVVPPGLGLSAALSVANYQAASVVFTPKQFLARGDGIADDTDAVQAALDAAQALGARARVDLTTGRFRLTARGTGGACLYITRQIQLVGAGMYSALVPDPSVDPSVATLKITPNVNFGTHLWTITGLHLGDPNTGTRAGGAGLWVDTTHAGAYLPGLLLRGCFIGLGAGPAVYHVNDAALNPNGGWWGGVLAENFLRGGISLNDSGDSFAILRNVISGTSTGIYAGMVDGANQLHIVGNNITSTGGAIEIARGRRVLIAGNNIEQPSPGGTANGAMIDANGAAGTIAGLTIVGNNLGAFTGTGITANIRVRNTLVGYIARNALLPASAATVGIDLDASTDLEVGPNTYGTNMTTPVRDTANGTRGIVHALTLANSWAAKDLANYGAPSYARDRHGRVTLTGVLSGGTATTGTTITTLPAGFRPAQLEYLPVAVNTAGTWSAGVLSVDPLGVVRTVSVAGNTSLGLGGVSFPTAGGSATISDA